MSSHHWPVSARFWLLDATDSLEEQSRREPDGWGLGWFDELGEPHVDRDPLPAWSDVRFDTAARSARSARFVAHVRYASTGPAAPENTHPFVIGGRLCAHNGVLEDLDLLRDRLGPRAADARGDTDSELSFLLLDQCIAEAGGDVVAGIRAAATWIGAHLPVYAWNVVVADADALYALRWPDTHELWWLQRAAGGVHGGRHFVGAGSRHPLTVHASELRERAAAIVASEPMDEDPGWRQLAVGELLVADGDVRTVQLELPDPSQRLTLEQLDAEAARSQT
jgi:glutamine amidotransferase